MTIDEHIGVIEDLKSTMSVCMTEPEKSEICTSLSEAIDTMRKYQMFQAKYAERLKADMVAMLTDMLIDVEEIASREQWCDYANDNCISRYDVEDLFQQKINALKADTEDQDV